MADRLGAITLNLLTVTNAAGAERPAILADLGRPAPPGTWA